MIVKLVGVSVIHVYVRHRGFRFLCLTYRLLSGGQMNKNRRVHNYLKARSLDT